MIFSKRSIGAVVLSLSLFALQAPTFAAGGHGGGGGGFHGGGGGAHGGGGFHGGGGYHGGYHGGGYHGGHGYYRGGVWIVDDGYGYGYGPGYYGPGYYGDAGEVTVACAPAVEKSNVDHTLAALKAKSQQPGFEAVGAAVAQIEDSARAAKSPSEKTQIEIEGLLNRFGNLDAGAKQNLPAMAKDFFDTNNEPKYISLARSQFNLESDAQAKDLVRTVKVALTTQK